jgi:hypothetical protein
MDKFFCVFALSAVCSAPVIAKDSEKPETAIVDLSPKLPKPPPNDAAQASSSASSETTTGENRLYLRCH